MESNRQIQPQLTNWDGPRIFLEVARSGSVRLAAQRLGRSANWVRTQLDAFERQIGIAFFEKSDGLNAPLTPEGRQVLTSVERMETITFDLLRQKEAYVSPDVQTVRVAVTEGFGAFWLPQFLPNFHRAHPGVSLDLRCAMQPVDLHKGEADIAVQLFRPLGEDLQTKRLGSLHVMGFGSEEYLDVHGTPKSVDDLLNHRLILQFGPQTQADEVFRAWLPRLADDKIPAVRTNTSSSLYSAIAKGVGLGVLPTYAFAMDPKLVPVNIGVYHRFDIWLSFRQGSARIQGVIDWLVEAFDPEKYPWFSDQFLHPDDLRKKYKGKSLSVMREGLEPTLEAFEISGEAVVLLDRDGQVLRSNDSAARLLTGDISISGKRIVIRDHQAMDMFKAALRDLLSTESRGVFANPVALPRRGRRPVLAYPLRLSSLSGKGLADCQAAVLFVDPEKQAEPSSVALRSAFGLTTAESLLAMKIATGQALESACLELKISKETGRSQLKRIFSKLGVNRQHELVAMLSTLLRAPGQKHKG